MQTHIASLLTDPFINFPCLQVLPTYVTKSSRPKESQIKHLCISPILKFSPRLWGCRDDDLALIRRDAHDGGLGPHLEGLEARDAVRIGPGQKRDQELEVPLDGSSSPQREGGMRPP